MDFWTINSDLVPRLHESYLMGRTYWPLDGMELLEITPEWVYGASGADEIVHTSNNHVARETLSAYSDGMGGSCADHIVVEHGMLCVPLWRDEDAGPERGYHPAAIVGLSLLARMDDYPLLDEDDYSEREYNAWHAYLTDEFHWTDDGDRESSAIDSHRTRFLAYCWENLIGYFGVYDVPTDAIERAYATTREETVNA